MNRSAINFNVGTIEGYEFTNYDLRDYIPMKLFLAFVEAIERATTVTIKTTRCKTSGVLRMKSKCKKRKSGEQTSSLARKTGLTGTGILGGCRYAGRYTGRLLSDHLE